MAEQRARMTVEAEVRLVGLVVRPGDTLIVAVARDTSMADAVRLKSLLSERLPDIEVVVVPGAEQFAAYRPGGDDD